MFVLSAEQRQHTACAELREPMDVEVLAVERGLIDLEIPRVHHDAAGRLDRHRHAVRHAVGHTHELERERPDGHPFARLHLHEPRRRIEPVLLELGPDQRERERRPVNRTLHIRQHVRDGADVILVPVRQHQRRNVVLLELAQIRNDQIDAEQLRLRKHHAGIDQDGRVAAGDDHHVHAELAEPAERDQVERRPVESVAHETNPVSVRINRGIPETPARRRCDTHGRPPGEGGAGDVNGRRRRSSHRLAARWDGGQGREKFAQL